MAKIERTDESIFLGRLRQSVGITISKAEQLFVYFSFTRGAGAAECFVRNAKADVKMVDPDRKLFDFLYEDWSASRARAFGGWNWGWVQFGDGEGIDQLHLFDEQLTDKQVMGMEHGIAWRHQMFGSSKISFLS
jgi:hypothetical protein